MYVWCVLLQADEIVELCDSCEQLFKQEKSVLELKVGQPQAQPMAPHTFARGMLVGRCAVVS